MGGPRAWECWAWSLQFLTLRNEQACREILQQSTNLHSISDEVDGVHFAHHRLV
jgi:hypothetical protein